MQTETIQLQVKTPFNSEWNREEILNKFKGKIKSKFGIDDYQISDDEINASTTLTLNLDINKIEDSPVKRIYQMIEDYDDESMIKERTISNSDILKLHYSGQYTEAIKEYREMLKLMPEKVIPKSKDQQEWEFVKYYVKNRINKLNPFKKKR
jgi:uncharacterized circularly permuted ATP-grasp superfamily protein